MNEARRREELVDRLYRETALYYRQQRIQDIQSTINRARGQGGNVSQLEVAHEGWGHIEPGFQEPVPGWLDDHTETKRVILPEGEVRLPAAENMFESTTLYFGKNPPEHLVCASREEAELLFRIAEVGVRGSVPVPDTEEKCRDLLLKFEDRLARGRARIEELAAERAGTEKMRQQIFDIMWQWFIHGKPKEAGKASRKARPRAKNVETPEGAPTIGEGLD